MKNRNLLVSLALFGGLMVAGAAQAEGKIYVGAKLGVMDADIPGFDNAYVGGVYGGYNLLGKDAHFAADLKGGTLAVEGEALLTLVKGKSTAAGKWDINNVSVYAAYRHPITDYFYLKGKLGIARYDIGTTIVSPYSGTENKLAAGIGAGWKVGPGRVEADLVTYEGDILFLSAGFHMSF